MVRGNASSTAQFDGAHNNTLPVELDKWFNKLIHKEAMVCVLPVPGGPSIRMIYGVRAFINNVAGANLTFVCVNDAN